jgi:hypothetical protein
MEIKKSLYAFVGANNRIKRLFKEEQPADKIPSGVTQILLTEEQFNKVQELRLADKTPALVDNIVIELVKNKNK